MFSSTTVVLIGVADAGACDYYDKPIFECTDLHASLSHIHAGNHLDWATHTWSSRTLCASIEAAESRVLASALCPLDR